MDFLRRLSKTLQLQLIFIILVLFETFCMFTHSFPMHPFSTLRKHKRTVRFSFVFRGVEKGCIRNEWVNYLMSGFSCRFVQVLWPLIKISRMFKFSHWRTNWWNQITTVLFTVILAYEAELIGEIYFFCTKGSNQNLSND